MVLNDDMIDFLKFRGQGVATLYSTWIEWVAEQFKIAISERKNQLPKKAVDDASPFMYSAVLPLHNNFDTGNGYLRNKFNNCLESVIKKFDSMRMLWIKEH